MSDLTYNEFKSGVQWAAQKGRKTREVREKVHRAYLDYIKADKTEAEAVSFCIDRFSEEHEKLGGYPLTEKIVRNIVSRPVGSIGDSLTEATVIANTQHLMADLELAKEKLQEEIDSLDEAESQGVQWYTVKRTTSGKNGDTEENIPIPEARLRFMKEQLDLYKRFEGRLALLMPKKDGLNIIIGDNSKVSMIGDDDLRQMIEARESRLGKRVTGIGVEVRE